MALLTRVREPGPLDGVEDMDSEEDDDDVLSGGR
jgi:hypothetical protein